jgi:hypothetical protein
MPAASAPLMTRRRDSADRAAWDLITISSLIDFSLCQQRTAFAPAAAMDHRTLHG